MKITVIGSGYVGQVSGACLAGVGDDLDPAVPRAADLKYFPIARCKRIGATHAAR